jgi:hypothetical protein
MSARSSSSSQTTPMITPMFAPMRAPNNASMTRAIYTDEATDWNAMAARYRREYNDARICQRLAWIGLAVMIFWIPMRLAGIVCFDWVRSSRRGGP